MGKPVIEIERSFRPEIEGLRIVAALLVAIYHIWFNKVSGGVDVFFVISGFLITTSIISTINKTGKFEFWPYISKLMKRLFPAVFFILGIVLILSFFILPSSILDKTIREVIASMFYYQNWQLAISNTDYLDASQMKTPVEHFWALSIQGQFYLIWFLLFSFALYVIKKYKLTQTTKLINFILVTVFTVSFLYSIYLTNANQPVAYFITFTRVWEFALGGLICINLSKIRVNKIVAFWIGWIGLIGLVLTGIIFNVSEMFPGYIALWPMLCAVFIVISGTVDGKYNVKKFLGSKPMMKLGGISFSIYLWHWVILQFYRYNVQDIPSILVGIMIILASIVLAFITTEYIEKPIRNSKLNKIAFRRLIIMGSLNFLIIGGLLINVNINKIAYEKLINDSDHPGAMVNKINKVLPEAEPIPPFSEVFDDLPLAHRDGTNQGLKKSDLKVGENGKTENYTKTIALIGSSHSEHWQGAILEAVKDTDYRVLNLTRSGTRFSTGYEPDDMKGIWNQHVLDYLKTADVDLVISHATASNTDNKTVQQQMIDQLLYVKNELGIDALAIRDNPRYSFNVLESLETKGETITIEKMNADNNQQDEEYWDWFNDNDDELYKLDLTEYFKVDGEFRPIIGNVVIYRDERHMTNTYSESFGPILKEELIKILENDN